METYKLGMLLLEAITPCVLFVLVTALLSHEEEMILLFIGTDQSTFSEKGHTLSSILFDIPIQVHKKCLIKHLKAPWRPFNVLILWWILGVALLV